MINKKSVYHYCFQQAESLPVATEQLNPGVLQLKGSSHDHKNFFSCPHSPQPFPPSPTLTLQPSFRRVLLTQRMRLVRFSGFSKVNNTCISAIKTPPATQFLGSYTAGWQNLHVSNALQSKQREDYFCSWNNQPFSLQL